jgi:hypothetical protein
MKEPRHTPPARGLLRDMFNAVVREAHEMFPETIGRFCILNVVDQEIHGRIWLENTGLPSYAALERIIDKEMRKTDSSPTATLARGARIISYRSAAGSDNMFAGFDAPPEINLMAIFDHEMAHLLIPGAIGGDTLSQEIFSESAADVYAVIRSIQRFGNDSPGAKILAWARADNFITTGQAGHFTFFALKALERLQEDIDVTKLSPRESLDLARRIAAENTPSEKFVMSLKDAFAPYRRARREGGIFEGLAVLAEMSLDRRETRAVADISTAVLAEFLDGKISIDGHPCPLRGRYWDAVRDDLDAANDNTARKQRIKGYHI